MSEALLLAVALLCSLCGMAGLALAMDVHWEQVRGHAGPTRGVAAALRAFAVAAIAGSLALCLAADHASIAVLVWIMSLVGAGILVAAALSTRS